MVIPGGTELDQHSYNYDHQVVSFQLQLGILSAPKAYNIWKKELSDEGVINNRYHREVVEIRGGPQPLDIVVNCKEMFMG